MGICAVRKHKLTAVMLKGRGGNIPALIIGIQASQEYTNLRSVPDLLRYKSVTDGLVPKKTYRRPIGGPLVFLKKNSPDDRDIKSI